MTTKEFANLNDGDNLKWTVGSDVWILEIVAAHHDRYRVNCKSGPGGVGNSYDM